jgi:hypothetical protein
MDFSEILNKKISELATQRDSITELIVNPHHHVNRTEKMTLQVIQQLAELDLDKQGLENEMTSILQQIPEFVGEAWDEATRSSSILNTEIARWTEMATMYEEYEKSVAEEPQTPAPSTVLPASHEDELLRAIEHGEILEPSARVGMRRKPGERPPITLGAYRKLSTKLESGEDS